MQFYTAFTIHSKKERYCMDLSKNQPIPELPKRLKETLLFIAWYFQKYNQYPTQMEIARGIGLSKKTKTAAGYIEPLIKKGYLSKENQSGKRKLRLTTIADKAITETDLKNYERSKEGFQK